MTEEGRYEETPGPWENRGRIREPDGAEWLVCNERGLDTLIVVIESERPEADAHLIAAAPDLLAALQRLSRTTTVDRDGNYHCDPEAWRQADDAIERALPPTKETTPLEADGG